MKIISFAWTTPALLAGQKTCTRREWNKEYAQRFKKGDLIQAYNKNPRNGGKLVATIELTQDVYLEYSTVIPNSDWFAEGFEYLTGHGITLHGTKPVDIWRAWLAPPPSLLWVVRFKIHSPLQGQGEERDEQMRWRLCI